MGKVFWGLGIWIYGRNWGALILEQETWKPKDRIAHGASILRSALLRRTGSERLKYFQRQEDGPRINVGGNHKTRLRDKH